MAEKHVDMSKLPFHVILGASVGGMRHAAAAAASLASHVEQVHAAAIMHDAKGAGASAEAYAKRVGQETTASFADGLASARELLIQGHADHIETTVVCTNIPIRRGVFGHSETAYTVGSDVVAALGRAREQPLELRTTPSTWTTAPPGELFEPMLPPRIAAVMRDP